MKLNLEFLGALYRYKVEAEQALEKLEEERKEILPVDEAKQIIAIRNMELKHAQEIVNRYTNLISTYIAHHS